MKCKNCNHEIILIMFSHDIYHADMQGRCTTSCFNADNDKLCTCLKAEIKEED